MIEYENLRLSNQSLFNEYKTYFDEFLNSGWYILGKNVTDFEEAYANFCTTQFCIGVASGLDALTLAIDACDFPKNSEIIVPANTYIATIMGILRNGHKPVLVEPDIKTYNIDPSKIEAYITSKTKAILPAHLYGKVCNMDAITTIADKYNLKIIEDAAQAQGAMFNNKIAGSFGIGCHSFYPTKNLGALGDGGAITTNEEWLNKKIRSLRNYGSYIKYNNDELGYNSRLDELQAGVLSIKLKILNNINAHKRALAQIYTQNLKADFIKPVVDEKYYDVYHIYNIRHPKRDELKEYLLKNNIKTEIHYPIPPYRQKAMQSFFLESYPITDEIHRTTLSLPISYYHTQDDIEQVVKVINRF